jgi:Phosphate transporter family
MSSLSLPVLIGLIVVALAFDFLNGLHDTANSIATLVSTRMLRPRYAVMWAAFFNFIAFLVFGVHVARTIGVSIVSADVLDGQVDSERSQEQSYGTSSLGGQVYHPAARTPLSADWSVPGSPKRARAQSFGLAS